MAHLLSERPSDGGSILGVYARKSCGPECVRPVFHPSSGTGSLVRPALENAVRTAVRPVRTTFTNRAAGAIVCNRKWVVAQRLSPSGSKLVLADRAPHLRQRSRAPILEIFAVSGNFSSR